MKCRSDFEKRGWLCIVCDKPNSVDVRRCNNCGCPSTPTGKDVLDYRDAMTGTIRPQKTTCEFFKKYRPYIYGFLFGFSIFLCFLCLPPSDIFKFTDESQRSLQRVGLLGDYIGGILGTLFTLGSVLLLLVTLGTQIKASKFQNFETKYYELIKIHRDNVAEFQLGPHSGRKVFVSMVREFQGILREVRNFTTAASLNFSQPEFVHIAYYAFFYGVGPNSSRMLKSALGNFNEKFIDDLIKHLENAAVRHDIGERERLDYNAVDGHQSRLGHYYRHLYQSIMYVHQQDIEIERNELVKTIRAQLTNYEQALLFINSRTPIGERWWKDHLIDTYGLVKNIPENFFDKKNEIDVESYFRSGYFEWQENKLSL